MSLERLVNEARERMGSTAEIRRQQARQRTKDFNIKLAVELEAQKVTRELLEKVIDL